jgi:hypothetical protein
MRETLVLVGPLELQLVRASSAVAVDVVSLASRVSVIVGVEK